MYISEIFGKEDKIGYDLIDDIVYFINHDEQFYRTDAFPVIDKFIELCDAGKPPSVGYFKVLAKNGYREYQVKFPNNHLPDQLSKSDLKDLCYKLFKQEFDRYHNKDEPSLDTISEDLDDLRKLAGISNRQEFNMNDHLSASKKSKIMKEHNIKPGSDAWFKLWFARTAMTGELPFGGYDNNEF